ncbi:phytanoyl-CoA dioxygenase [Actinomadura logoneensis]|uniref:Phytanoyl-CoA dioxygenase n=1 Tax=Actinomadura logoneensis TaxID=2293572 RepID=A0A372JCX2_9ACTN|nr:phytanoyl-CoA dioxygenase [Actinomadura logoneensis]RFU37855.1 phytanoyl-CoA dioxygenase [Actinomadura logoneensis]
MDIDVESFIRDGFVRVSEAFPRSVADEGRALLWEMSGCSPDDPSTWTKPVIRLYDQGQPPFREAAQSPRLHEAYDALVGRDRWVPRKTVGGSYAVRFPLPDAPGDDGWHIESSFPGPNPDDYLSYRVNLTSRGRALLVLFLFSDVGEDDAPTRVRVGSHLDVPPLLEPAGDDGLAFMDIAGKAVAASEHRDVAFATGRAGDVYLCHPFLVHAAQSHQGRNVKFMAQPGLEPAVPLSVDGPSPVERAIKLGLTSH